MITLSAADRRTRFGGLILDLTLTEEVSFQAEATQYPIEDGSIISDHITQGTETLRLAGTIPTVDAFAFQTSADGAVKVVDVIEKCRDIHVARRWLDVSTGQLLYTDMACTNLTATRAADDNGGNWLSISADFTKIHKVSLKTAEVPDEQRVSEQDGAQGRAGQTNKPAGKNTSTTNREVQGPPDPGQSLLYTGRQSGLTPQNLFNGLRGAAP